MKTRKKILSGFALLWVATLLIPLFSFVPKAAAQSTTQNDAIKCADNLKFVDIAEVDCAFTPDGQSSQTTVKFIDSHPDDYDSNSCDNSGFNNGCLHVMNYKEEPPYGFFCDSKNTPTGFNDNYYYATGVTIMGIGNRPLNQADAGNSLQVNINLGYEDSNASCKRANDGESGHDGTMHRTLTGTQTTGISNLLQYGSGNTVVSLTGIQKGRLNSKTYAESSYQGAYNVFVSGYNKGKCSGDLVFVDSGGTATRYTLNSDNNLDGTKFPELVDFLKSPEGTAGCGQHDGQDQQDQQSRNFYKTDTTFTILGTPLPIGGGGGGSCDPTKDPTCTTAPQSDEAACEALSTGFSLSWLFCPVLTAANGLANTLTDTFQQQLSFTIPSDNNCQNSQGTAITSSGCTGLKTAWSVFRLIASSLVIIIMLVMIVSEALGGIGAIDAYAIRRMLPKLVAAVIVIQISWPVGVWIINSVDDLARQLANIMYLPFGGPKVMTLAALMNNAHIGTGTGAAFSWIAILGVIIAAVLALPIVIMFCFMAIMAVLTGLIVLIFRKIIIMMALLFMPLAILAWILPGTQRYYKLWSSNFGKALFMFPLAIAMIASGRIFAHIAATNDVGTLMNFLIVLVGFFGPLFILPKTWKWGGQAMQAVGGYAQTANSKLQERPNKYFKARQEDWTANRRRNSQERVGGKKEYGRIGKAWQFPLDKFRSGAWDPLRGGRGSRNRFEAMAQYAAAGRESSGKTYEAAKAAAQQLFDTAADHDAVAQMLMRGGDFDYIDKKGKLKHYKAPTGGSGKNYMRAAGAAGIGKYGTDGSNRVFQAEIDRMRAAGGDEALLAEEILDENVGTMKSKMDSMYRGFNRHAYEESLAADRSAGRALDYQKATRAGRRGSIHSSIDSMKEDWFQGMEGVEAQSLLAGLSQGVAEGDAQSIEKMRKLWRNYQAARENPNIQIAPGVHKAFKAYADRNEGSTSRGSIEEINDDRDNEVNTRVRGDITDDEGRVVERRDRTERVRDHPVLDKIDRDHDRNRAMIEELGAAELMADYDGDGAPVPGAAARRAAGGGGTRARGGRAPVDAPTPRPGDPSFFDPDSMDSGTVHFYHERSPGPSPAPVAESAAESRPLSVSHDEATSGASEASPEARPVIDEGVGAASADSATSSDVVRAAAAAGAAAGARAAAGSARLSTGQVSAGPVTQATNPGETVAPGAVIAPTARDSAGQGLGRDASRELVEAIQENTRAQQKVQTELKRQKPGVSQNFPAAPNEVTIINREEPPQTPPAP